MIDKPLLPDLTDCQQCDVDRSPIFDEQQLPVLLPVPAVQKKTLSDVAAMVKPKAMAMAYDYFVNRSLLAWAHDCLQIERQNQAIEATNTAQSQVFDERQTALINLVPYLAFPVRPVFDSFEQWQANNSSDLSEHFKLHGVEIMGARVSLTRDDQNGLLAVGRMMDRAISAGKDAETLFKFENGTQFLITTDNYIDFEIEWTAARQQFFNVGMH